MFVYCSMVVYCLMVVCCFVNDHVQGLCFVYCVYMQHPIHMWHAHKRSCACCCTAWTAWARHETLHRVGLRCTYCVAGVAHLTLQRSTFIMQRHVMAYRLDWVIRCAAGLVAMTDCMCVLFNFPITHWPWSL